MLTSDELVNEDKFEQELCRLCRKIETLPQQQRPHLLALAEVIRQQHRLVSHEHASSIDV